MTSEAIFNRHDEVYHNLLKDVLSRGQLRKNRTGVDTLSVFGGQIEFDIKQTFPALTTKRMAWRAIVSELLWFLTGEADERFLAYMVHKNGKNPFEYYKADYDSVEEEEDRFVKSFETHKTIWTENVQSNYWVNRNKQLFVGDAGRIYGVQWRNWKTPDGRAVDQVSNLIDGLIKDPMGRRHIVTAWNPGELDDMCLPPCHIFAQFNVTNDGYLECHMYQRSVDTFLGLPFNIASYSLLTYIIAQLSNLKPGRLIMSFGDIHIYKNHTDQVMLQLQRESRQEPTLSIPDLRQLPLSFFHELIDEFKLNNYNPHPAIKAPMAV
jgi:thymidylate synthase